MNTFNKNNVSGHSFHDAAQQSRLCEERSEVERRSDLESTQFSTQNSGSFAWANRSDRLRSAREDGRDQLQKNSADVINQPIVQERGFWALVARLEERSPKLARFVRNYYTSIAFVFGFIWDNLTLTRIDLWLDNFIISAYLVIAAIGITVYNLADRFKEQHRYAQISPWLPIAIQFAFGGLFSGYFVFYSRSASLAASWPFLLFLVAILIGNEFFEKRYERLTFQLSVFFIALCSYAIFAVPVLLGAFGAGIFLVAVVVSVVAFTLFFLLLRYLLPARMHIIKRLVVANVALIVLGFNVLYFTNIIPPVPLSLKQIGIYHHVERVGDGSYVALDEPGRRNFFQRVVPWFRADRTLQRAPGERLYCFSAVFAPTSLNTTVYHDWQYYDEVDNVWIQTTRVGFDIAGGQDGGYRGFTFKESLFPGKWRCDVETVRGQLIGRRVFEIVEVAEPVALEERIL